MQHEKRPGTRLMDRPEYREKPRPLTFAPDASVAEAVRAMSEKNYGSVVVIDDDRKVTGIVTERDVLKRLVDAGRDASKTELSEIMTAQPRVARETDDVLEWMRIMSNDRFRRLPVVDAEGRIAAVFTQGDFVSYTWPDLMYQAGQIARATVTRNFPYVLIGGGIALYTLVMIVVLASVL
jgi:CBS domain-containing protein